MSIARRVAGIELGRVVQAGTGLPRYLALVNAKGIGLSVHVGYLDPKKLCIFSRNANDDHRPIFLDRAEATALRDALELFLEDQPSS